MKIDEFSLSFNCSVDPSWGTAVVEQDAQNRHLIKVEEAGNILLGMLHNQVPINTHDFSIPIGKGAKVYYGDTGFEGATSEPILVSVFNKTIVNGKPVGYPFILVLTKDRTTHEGRLQLKYSPKISYGSISNREFVRETVDILNISESTPLMFYEIDVDNQDTLILTAVYGDSLTDIRAGIDNILSDKISNAKRTRKYIINESAVLSEDDLARILNAWYKENGPNAIRVFGIKYGSYFVDREIAVSKFLKKCKDIGSSYETELSKGIQLYKSIKSGDFGLLFYDDLYDNNGFKVNMDLPLQLIYFGAPGTSKSTTIKKKIGNAPQHRITFHPDTDYANFVGCYKPTKNTESDELTYKFVAQTFVKAYVDAWKNLVNENIADKEVFLIIEEINRGNCAQIFGDLFQLLDRDDNGFSDYAIEPDADLQRYLAENAFKGCVNVPEKIRSGELMRLPPNLFIWATMNTSDQSLFPIDSAFKRRWEWKYLPIKNDLKGHIIRVTKDHAYDWWEFLDAVNKRIEKLTEQEDKQLGYWFAKPNKGVEISVDRFVSKVVFYLWNDVFKDFAKDANSPFVIKDPNDKRHELKFNMFFDNTGKAIPAAVEVFIEGLGVKPLPTQNIETENNHTGTPVQSSENQNEDPLQTTEEEREIEEYNESFNTDYDDADAGTQGTLFDEVENEPNNFLKELYGRQ